ncbi:hypothetical protein Trydic_g3936 [Trypoxylus dichotomus]
MQGHQPTRTVQQPHTNVKRKEDRHERHQSNKIPVVRRGHQANHTATRVKGNGEVINNIRYVDDTVVITESLAVIQSLIDRIVEKSEDKELTLKTKFMIIAKL